MASVYVRLSEAATPLAVSTHEAAEGINVDYDHRGEAIGVEILGARSVSVNGVRLGLPDED